MTISEKYRLVKALCRVYGASYSSCPSDEERCPLGAWIGESFWNKYDFQASRQKITKWVKMEADWENTFEGYYGSE